MKKLLILVCGVFVSFGITSCSSTSQGRAGFLAAIAAGTSVKINKTGDKTAPAVKNAANNEAAVANVTPTLASPSASPVAAVSGSPVVAAAPSAPDFTKGVNAAPVTGLNSENTFALVIANEDYGLVTNVDNAVNDGLAFKEYCIKTLGLPSENVRYYSNLTYGRMRKALADIVDIASIVGPEAKLMVYYAGHGIPDNKTKNAFLMPVDADGTDTDVCLSLGDFYDRLNASSAGLCLVFLDACFSGAQRGGDMIVAARGVKLRPQPAAPKGNTVVFSATSGDEAAYSYKDEEHGLFTYFLLKKMQESKGNVSLGALADYLTKKVSLQSRLINNNPQTPTVNVAQAMEEKWRSIKLNNH
ncbi:MAG: caspase family protein [Candidatus Amulumruptor caecigallinarius]|nr:caspase family protein [Candidatus Amulumruptor caecigallinarius]MCM1396368.1 caspase family protein [Candidatus Amulumruptor caecigallinarius]MCM1453690.1 caspase family protein [bacterium]